MKDINIENLNTKYKKEAKPILKKLAEEFGVFKEYSNEDIDLKFDYSRNSFSESVNKQSKEYLNFAKMLTVFDEIINNAIGIEVHGDRYAGTARADTKLLNTYVLISAFSDEDGITPVKLLVKELRGEKNKLYLAVSTQKIKAGISAQTSGNKSTGLKYAPPTSIISLSDFFENVNHDDKDIVKYIPKQFLAKEENVSDVKSSESFKNWFGDWENDQENASKVVNDDGTPKIVYHGTSNGGFNSFDTYGSNFGLFGNGSYFTESENVAKSYTNKGKGTNKQVYSVYLDFKNPIDMDAPADILKWNKAFEEQDIDVTAEMGDSNEQVYRKFLEELEYNYYSKYEAEEIISDIIQNAMGYDGITHTSCILTNF